MDGSQLWGLPAVPETQLLYVQLPRLLPEHKSPEPRSCELVEAFCPSGTQGEICQLTSVTKFHWARADGGEDTDDPPSLLIQYWGPTYTLQIPQLGKYPDVIGYFKSAFCPILPGPPATCQLLSWATPI